MPTVTVRLGRRSYPIHIGPAARRELGSWLRRRAAGRQLAVIADQAVADLHLAALREDLPTEPAVLAFPPGESSKSLAMAGRLFDQLAAARVERSGVIITLGGGVAGDLGGFVAATWLRGVRLVQVATTLLAAVDASVGGKTGLNLAAGKNLVGAFHQPAAVIVDTDFLQTLSERDFRAGLAESVKHAAIRDGGFLGWHEQSAEAILRREAPAVGELIARNCAIKAAVVARDEREAHLRAVLNLGHTVGHALEHALAYELRHGECVALGMIVENEIACARGWLARLEADRVRALLARLGLPQRLPRPLPASAVWDACAVDKKVRGGVACFVLLRGPGQVEIGVSDVTRGELEHALGAIQPG